MSTSRLPGYATPEGTRRFAERALSNKMSGSISEEHFRKTLNELSLSSIGMGTYLGNAGEPDFSSTVAAVKASVESGVMNVFDTAINYRQMDSERAIGQAIAELVAEQTVQRDELFISSKIGYLTPDASVSDDFKTYFNKEFIETGLVKAGDIASGVHCMTPDYLNHQLDTMLNNLGLETVDLLYLHNPAESQLKEVGVAEFFKRLQAAFKFLESARKSGKIRYYGMATWNCFTEAPDFPSFLSLEAVAAMAEDTGGKDHGFRFIQLPINLGMVEAFTKETQSVDNLTMPVLKAADALDIQVFSSVPLMQGQLLGQPQLPEFPGISTDSQRCLQFVRSIPGLLAPLVGQKTPAHVAENIQIAQLSPLSYQEFYEKFLNEGVAQP